MRSISQDIIDKLESSEITVFHLLEFTVNETTYYYTDCEVKIAHAVDGTDVQTYLPRAFDFDPVSYSSNDIVDSCSIRVDNLDSVLTALFVDNVIIEETAKLYLIIFDDDNTIIDSQLIFNGLINDFQIDESELKMTVTSIFAKWDQSSGSNHSALCRWKKFKGTECGYSGSETECDRTYGRCTQLENSDNFGGFRWLPKIEDVLIWWGPTPSERREEG
jgi:hypothetical protein